MVTAFSEAGNGMGCPSTFKSDRTYYLICLVKFFIACVLCSDGGGPESKTWLGVCYIRGGVVTNVRIASRTPIVAHAREKPISTSSDTAEGTRSRVCRDGAPSRAR